MTQQYPYKVLSKSYIWKAITLNSVNCFTYLLPKTPPSLLNKQDQVGLTLLMKAILKNNPEMAKQILLYGGNHLNLNLGEKSLKTALHWSTLKNLPQTAHILIKKKVNLNSKDINGETALMMASQRNNLTILKLLLQNSVDVNLQDKFGHTALMDAASLGHLKIVQLLLEFKADKNLLNNEGQNAFELAYQGQHIECAQLLTTTPQESQLIKKAISTAQP